MPLNLHGFDAVERVAGTYDVEDDERSFRIDIIERGSDRYTARYYERRKDQWVKIVPKRDARGVDPEQALQNALLALREHLGG